MNDDDRNNNRRWWGWIIHYDPNNPRTFVRRREGLGFTINFATPLGKGLGVIIILAIIVFIILKHH